MHRPIPALAQSYRLDSSAALKSCSWCAFQILGTNYSMAGYGSGEKTVRDMSKSERPI
ncbi:DUF3380 domain-containing protein [Burkholderia glumae]|nr:N-acetylmuramidase domain-containing protein [Burkholderia glumae]MCQ0032265.1 N-acetylmuramidase family protein [Burkholderia glumae]QJW78785.1 N-acetylmuramidase family protein [Burkholderia glumae]RQZ69648.1 DUF3380 domain-containing protein [Burkholderia glumae]UVS83185.1 DUF3380 domain-containing protein [Burkholderia glumae]